MAKKKRKNLTIGVLRELIKDLPDDTHFKPDWAGEPPGDHEPGVEITGAALMTDPKGTRYLSIKVKLFYLNGG